MRVLQDGRYQLSDGRVLTQDELVRLHEKAPRSGEPEKPPPLQEGQSSGPIPLLD